MFFPVLIGSSCNYTATLGYTLVGRVTFDYQHPYLYLIDAGKNFPGPLAGFIKIYDCSNPSGITLVSTTSTPVFSGPERPIVNGNIMYLPYRRPNTPAQATAAGMPGVMPRLSCWDVSNKAAPVEVGVINMGYNSAAGQYNNPYGIALVGSTVCCVIGPSQNNEADAGGVDVSNPASPTLINNYKRASTSFYGSNVVTNGTYFFLIGVNGSGGPIVVIPVVASPFPTAGGNMLSNGTTNDGVSSCAISGDGQRIFIATTAGRFWVVDVSTPTSPSTISLTIPFGTNPSDGNAMIVIPQTNRLYVGSLNPAPGSIQILETVSATPTIVGSITLTSSPLEFQNVQSDCAGFAYTMFGSNDIHLLGTAPLS